MRRASLNYYMQRSSGALLVPLSLWLIFFVIPTIIPALFLYNEIKISGFFQSKVNIILLNIFLIIGLYHGFLGMASIFKDYIACDLVRKGFVYTLAFLVIFTCALGFTIILDQHFLTLIKT
jgi:succinate dehydrogenase hydrophobic membrane anchor protein